MKISLRTVVLGAVLAVGAALPVAAQDVSFGYQFQRISCCGHSDNFPMGFNVDASFPDWQRRRVERHGPVRLVPQVGRRRDREHHGVRRRHPLEPHVESEGVGGIRIKLKK